MGNGIIKFTINIIKYKVKRINVFPYTFYSCNICIDHRRTAGYLVVPIVKWGFHHFLPSHHRHFSGCSIHNQSQVAIVLLLYPSYFVLVLLPKYALLAALKLFIDNDAWQDKRFLHLTCKLRILMLLPYNTESCSTVGSN